MNWRDLMQDMAQNLRAAGIPEPQRESQYLLEWATGRTYAEWVVRDGAVADNALEKARSGLARRLAREPMAYITGHREFFGLDLTVSPSVLVPRPETEVLVEALLTRVARPVARVADVGTGSGAIALALKSLRPDWTMFGADISSTALEVARLNAEQLGLTIEWLESNLLDRVPTGLDAIAANLPYVDPGGTLGVSPETQYEPVLALYTDDGGLRVIRRLVQQAPGWLNRGGQIFLECGPDQAQTLASDLERAGWRHIAIIPDYAGWERVVAAAWEGSA